MCIRPKNIPFCPAKLQHDKCNKRKYMNVKWRANKGKSGWICENVCPTCIYADLIIYDMHIYLVFSITKMCTHLNRIRFESLVGGHRTALYWLFARGRAKSAHGPFIQIDCNIATQPKQLDSMLSESNQQIGNSHRPWYGRSTTD